MSKALDKALIQRNIMANFCSTWIYSLNPDAMNDHMGPTRQFAGLHIKVHQTACGSIRKSSLQVGASEALSRGGSLSDHSVEEVGLGSDSGSNASKDCVVR